MKNIAVTGITYYEDGDECDGVITIFRSHTKDHFHVIIDRYDQNNEYYHLTKQQIKEQYNIILAL